VLVWWQALGTVTTCRCVWLRTDVMCHVAKGKHARNISHSDSLICVGLLVIVDGGGGH